MTNKPDVLEIWEGDTLRLRVTSGFAPNEGDLINIQKVTYEVTGRSFTIDHADDPFLTQVRCNVIVRPYDGR